MAFKSFSTYQVAKKCNVHLNTVINWVNEGKLNAYTTPGGHRRILEKDLNEFVKKFKIPVGEIESKKVLIVDDDLEFLEELQFALTGHGFEIDSAADGFEAGRKVYRNSPDLILLDFKMPGLDGFGVCELLHGDQKTAHIPIIAITALNSEAEKENIVKRGVKAFMPKPVDVEKLLKAIKNILGIEVIV